MRKTRIRTIATEYKGTTFRSRTEARFARWCDSWRIKWLYEPEGFVVGNICYLPDFYLPEGRIVVEIKPPVFMDETWKLKALADAIRAEELQQVETGLREVRVTGGGDVRLTRHYGDPILWCGTMYGSVFALSLQWHDSGEWVNSRHLNGVRCTKCKLPYFEGWQSFDSDSAYPGSCFCPWCGNGSQGWSASSVGRPFWKGGGILNEVPSGTRIRKEESCCP